MISPLMIREEAHSNKSARFQFELFRLKNGIIYVNFFFVCAMF